MDTGILAGMAVYLSVCAQNVEAIIEFRILLPSLKLSTPKFLLNNGSATEFRLQHNI